MHHSAALMLPCSVREHVGARERERGVRVVVLLTLVMMLVEVVAGYLTGSMALLADGWHMATHVAALGLASLAYALSRRFAAHRAFALGTGKIHALAGYTSAVALGLVALLMLAESASRLLNAAPIDFESSLPVAVLGLLVNLASFRLLHGSAEGHAHDQRTHDAEHEHDHDEDHDQEDHDHEGHDHDRAPEHDHHDHNHRAAVLHVAADALTSVLAILALLAGKFAGYTWLDPVMGIVGGAIILKWGAALCKHAAFELLNVELSPRLEEDIRAALEQVDDARVSDLHVWSLGRGARGCVVTLISSTPRESAFYRQRLAGFRLSHLTIEIRRCTDGHAEQHAAFGGALGAGA